MKKFFIALTALAAVFAFSSSSFAASQVQVTLTSPTIYKAGCEKAGSVAFSFDEGSVIDAGDWWYMDLPNNVTLCKGIDYVIAAPNGALPTVNFAAGREAAMISNAGVVNVTLTNQSVSNMVTGPLQLETADASANASTPGLFAATGNMAFQVLGAKDGRRVAIYALTQAGGGSLTIGAGFKLDFKILDGAAHNVMNIAATNTMILVDKDGDKIYGEQNYSGTSDEVITGNDAVAAPATGIPYEENTLCVNAESYASDYVYVSFASKNDKFTFTGDSQIAHTAAKGSIALKACKGNTTDNIPISAQGSTCGFDYEDELATAGGYCENQDGDTVKFSNRILIEAATGNFGDIGDKYTLDAQIVAPADGVYFSAAPVVGLIKSTDDECAAAPTTSASGLTFDTYVNSVKTSSATYAGTSCTVTSTKRTNLIKSNNTMTLDGFDTVYVNFNKFAFDSSLVAAGEEVQVKVSLSRYPCGLIFEGTRTIGTFVTACASSSSTTLYFPWFPGSAATGWWGGYAITNTGTTSGVITLTYADADGKKATFTTPAIAAGAQFNSGSVAMSALTNVDGFDSTKNYSVSAACAFAAQGFAFNGNGREGVGYTAVK